MPLTDARIRRTKATEKLARRQDVDALVLTEDQQVLVPRDDHASLRRNGSGEPDVVDVSRNGTSDRGWFDDLDLTPELRQERDAGRADPEPGSQGSLQFLERRLRARDLAGASPRTTTS